jgi:tetratricopeptide (TPR) repeat protein
MSRLACALVLACLCAAAPRAFAQPAPSQAQVARKEHEEGRRAFAERRFAVALDHFQTAYALAPFPDLLFNIGRCQEELGRLAEAIDTYRRYLAVAPPGERDALQQLVTDLAARLARSPAPPPSLETGAHAPLLSNGVKTPAPKRKRARLALGLGLGGAALVVAGVALGLGLGLGLRDHPTRLPPVEFVP